MHMKVPYAYAGTLDESPMADRSTQLINRSTHHVTNHAINAAAYADMPAYCDIYRHRQRTNTCIWIVQEHTKCYLIRTLNVHILRISKSLSSYI